MKTVMDVSDVQVIRSSRKTLSLQIPSDGTVVVRAPMRMPQYQIQRFLEEKSEWIRLHLEKVNSAKKCGEAEPLSNYDIQELARAAAEDIPNRVRVYAAKMHISYGRITIRNQKTRWGSCSSQGNLNFNCLLMLAPEEVRDYVVVHELCHRLHMDHSAAFWAEIEAILPDYKKQKQWLKNNGAVLMARMEYGK